MDGISAAAARLRREEEYAARLRRASERLVMEIERGLGEDPFIGPLGEALHELRLAVQVEESTGPQHEPGRGLLPLQLGRASFSDHRGPRVPSTIARVVASVAIDGGVDRDAGEGLSIDQVAMLHAWTGALLADHLRVPGRDPA